MKYIYIFWMIKNLVPHTFYRSTYYKRQYETWTFQKECSNLIPSFTYTRQTDTLVRCISMRASSTLLHTNTLICPLITSPLSCTILDIVCFLLSDGMSCIHFTRNLQTMSFFTFQFAKLILAYRPKSVERVHLYRYKTRKISF